MPNDRGLIEVDAAVAPTQAGLIEVDTGAGGLIEVPAEPAATVEPEPTTLQSIMRLPTAVARGVAAGAETTARALRTAGLETGGFIEATERAQEALKMPESKVPLVSTLERGTESTFQSLTAMAPGVGLSVLTRGALSPAITGAGIAGLIFGAAQYDEFMSNIEKIGRANNATPDEISAAKDLVKREALFSALAEGLGESLSDILTAYAAGWFGPGAVATKVPLKSSTKAVAQALMKRFGIPAASEVTGEEYTTYIQHGAEGAAMEKIRSAFPSWKTPAPESLAEQMKETLGTTLVQYAEQTGIMLATRGKFVKGVGREKPTREEVVESKADQLIGKYNIDSTTARDSAEVLVEKADRDKIEKAVESLKEAKSKLKKKTKAQQVIDTIVAVEKVAPAEEVQLELPFVTKEKPVEPEKPTAKPLEVEAYPGVVPVESEMLKRERLKSRKKEPTVEVKPIEDDEDRAAIGIRIARSIGVDPAELTTAHLFSFYDRPGLEYVRDNGDRLEAIVNAVKRKLSGFETVKEAEAASVSRPEEVTKPAPSLVATPAAPPSAVDKEAQRMRLLELGRKSDEEIVAELNKMNRDEIIEFAKANGINHKGNTAAIRNRIIHYAKRAATNIPREPVAKPEEKGPEPKLRVAFRYIWDFGPQVEGPKRFVPMVHVPIEGGMTDVAYDPNKHELTNPDDYEREYARIRDVIEKEAKREISEGQAIESKVEAEPTSVENLNTADKSTLKSLVSKVKAVSGGEFYDLIRRLVHPRGEGMSPRDVAYAEGMSDLWHEAGIPKNQWIQAVRAVAYDSGAYTAEDVALDRFSEGIDFNIVVGQEYDRLVDSGRADELEKLGLTEDQIEAVLQKEAEEEAERIMQGKYNVLEEEITDHATANDESAKIETNIAIQAESELANELQAMEEQRTGAEQIFATKREAIAERNKKDNPSEWVVVKGENAKQWIVRRVSSEAPNLLDKAVREHTAYQSREEAEAIFRRLMEKGKPPDRYSDTKGFLASLHAAMSIAYAKGESVGQAVKSLNLLAVDLSQQAHRFSDDTSYVESLLNEVRYLQDYAVKITEALEGKPITYSGPTIAYGNYVSHYIAAEREFIDRLSATINKINEAGTATANDLVKLLRDWSHTPLYHKVFLSELTKPTVSKYLNEVLVDVVPKSDRGTSYYERGLAKSFNEATGEYGITAYKRIVLDVAHMKRAASVSDSIMHELIHGLLAEALDTVPRFNDAITELRMQALSSLPESEQMKIARMLPDDVASAYRRGILDKRISPRVYYALTSNHEFIAEAISSQDVMTFLHNISAVKPISTAATVVEGDTLWARFKKAVGRYVLLFTAPNEFTLLDETFRNINSIMNEYASHRARLDTMKAEDADRINEAKLGSIIYKNMTNDMDDIYKAINKGDVALVGYKKRDANWFSQMFVSPEAIKAVREDPLASKMADMCISAVDQHIYRRAIGFEEVDRIFKGIDEEGRKKITSAMREVEKGISIDQQNLPPRLKEAAKSLFRLQESYRLRMQNMMRTMLIRSMNQTEKRIFHDVVVNGVDAATAVKRWNSYARKINRQRAELIKKNPNALAPNREAVTTYDAMMDYFERYAEIGKWGFNDYVTKAMRGSIVVADEKGRVITVAETTKQAADRAVSFLREVEAGLIDPEKAPKLLFIHSDFHLDREAPTLVTARQYNAIRGRIQKAMTVEAQEIKAKIDKAVADKILRKSVSIKPRQVWTPFTEERREVLKGEEDISTIMPLYIHSIERKLAFDPYIQFFRKNIDRLNHKPGVKAVLEQQLEDARGKYWALDRIADSFMKQLGLLVGEAEASVRRWLGDKKATAIPPEWSEKPFAATRAIRDIRLVTANIKLGYRNIASIINLLSGMGHTWVKTNLKYMYNAHKILKTEEGRRFIERYAPDLGTSLAVSEAGEVKSRAKWWTPLGTFQLAETPNREVSFIATYLMGRDQGLDEEQAVQFAKRGVRLQQFNYNIASLPKVLRGPSGRLIGQFKSYLIKEIEFIRTLTAGEWAKYLAVQMALGGPRGFFITIKSLPPLIVLMSLINGLKGGGDWLDELDEWINVNLPRVSRGMFGFFGIDASGPASFQFPTDWRDWAGITLSGVVDFAKNVAEPFMRGEKYIKWHLYEFSKRQIPVWKVWSDMLESVVHDGWVWDEDGNRKYKVETPEDWIKAAAGAKPLRLGIIELQNRMIAKQEAEEKARAHNIVVNAVRMRRQLGDDGVVRQIVQDCMEYKVGPDTLTEAIERSEIDPLTRRVLRAKLANRLEIWMKARKAAGAAESVR